MILIADDFQLEYQFYPPRGTAHPSIERKHLVKTCGGSA